MFPIGCASVSITADTSHFLAGSSSFSDMVLLTTEERLIYVPLCVYMHVFYIHVTHCETPKLVMNDCDVATFFALVFTIQTNHLLLLVHPGWMKVNTRKMTMPISGQLPGPSLLK